MKETNNIDNQLRQLENQSLPDLSRQDEHWQEMQKMLQPSLAPVKPTSPTRLWKWLAVAGIAVVAFLLINNWVTEKKEKTAAVNITSNTSKNAEPSTIDTPETPITTTDSIPRKESEAAPLKIAVKPKPAGRTGYASIVTDPCDKCGTDWLNDPLPDSNNLAAKTPEPGATLASFFAQLEKPSQEFVIDNSRDTVINGNDGTALLIPANTFTTKGKVTLILKEYYSYEDIITNKLSTTSNGQQLITGGMIHLMAVADGKQVDMQPQKSIRWFVPDTTAEMKDMQLFNGQQNSKALNKNENATGDTVLYEEKYDNINWTPQDAYFGNGLERGLEGNGSQGLQVRVVDLRDYPYKIITRGKKTKAYYYWYEDSEISKEQLTAYLLAKNKNWYDKIIIRKTKHNDDWCSYTLRHEVIDCYTSLGDTMVMTPRLANIYKLNIIDTVKERRNIINGKKVNDNQVILFNLGKRYGVDINSLGWINCDRFYKKRSTNIPLYVDLKDTAANYYTVLVFDKIKSIMSGSISGNKVMFAGVPAGETAKVISVGIKDGKPVVAMELVTISKAEVNSLKFEETTPVAFKEQAAIMDK